MRAVSRVLIVLAVISWASGAQGGIRCGNDLISVGDTRFDVQVKLGDCGSILDRQQVGTRTETEAAATGTVAEERVVERWHIRVNERGGAYCYPLTFVEGVLTEIGSWRRCN